MEILQTIWTALSTPNEGLTSILISIIAIIEFWVTMLLYSTILNLSLTKKQKTLYLITLYVWSFLSNMLLDDSISSVLNIFIMPLSIMILFKLSFFKSVVAEIIAFFSIILSETLFLKAYIGFFNITPEIANTTPIYRISFALILYLFIYLMYKLVKNFNFNITILDNMDKKSKILLTISFILCILNIFIQNYVNSYYSDILPIVITLLSTFTLLAFFIVGLYSLSKTTQLQLTTQNLEEAQLYNKSLKILHDNVRAFKHDFSNIVQAIGRIYWNE